VRNADNKGGRFTAKPKEKPSDVLNIDGMSGGSPKSSGNRNRTTKKRGTSRRPGNGDPNLPPNEGEEDEDYDDCITVDGV
jgi:hypothetical protein